MQKQVSSIKEDGRAGGNEAHSARRKNIRDARDTVTACGSFQYLELRKLHEICILAPDDLSALEIIP